MGQLTGNWRCVWEMLMADAATEWVALSEWGKLNGFLGELSTLDRMDSMVWRTFAISQDYRPCRWVMSVRITCWCVYVVCLNDWPSKRFMASGEAEAAVKKYKVYDRLVAHAARARGGRCETRHCHAHRRFDWQAVACTANALSMYRLYSN